MPASKESLWRDKLAIKETTLPSAPTYRELRIPIQPPEALHRRTGCKLAQLAPDCVIRHRASGIRHRRAPQVGILISQSSQVRS